MENLFVSFKIAMALKALGFDEPCLTYYYNDGTTSDILAVDRKMEYYINSKQSDWSPFGASAPHYLQAQDWLRDKYSKIIQMQFKLNIKKWDFIVYDMNLNGKEYIKYYKKYYETREHRRFDDYYEALDAAIEEALTLIK